jgi:hypothetical protein
LGFGRERKAYCVPSTTEIDAQETLLFVWTISEELHRLMLQEKQRTENNVPFII